MTPVIAGFDNLSRASRSNESNPYRSAPKVRYVHGQIRILTLNLAASLIKFHGTNASGEKFGSAHDFFLDTQ
jgi:hypothetical protein